MKIINIADAKSKKMIRTLEAESRVYDMLSSEYVVKSLFRFVHDAFLCFVTEYMPGGDFAFLLHKYF